jgi:hypothetical protein
MVISLLAFFKIHFGYSAVVVFLIWISLVGFTNRLDMAAFITKVYFQNKASKLITTNNQPTSSDHNSLLLNMVEQCTNALTYYILSNYILSYYIYIVQ